MQEIDMPIFWRNITKSEAIGVPEKDELPWTLISNVESEKEEDVCFSVEPFCSIISETSLNSENVVDFLKLSTFFANNKLCGSLVATVIIHPKLLKDPAVVEAFEQSVDDLKFGSIGINYWAEHLILQ